MLKHTGLQIAKITGVITTYHYVPHGFCYVIGFYIACIVYKRHFKIVRVSKRQMNSLKKKWEAETYA